ncbi:Unknown protein, partial [Striga hermonthica]
GVERRLQASNIHDRPRLDECLRMAHRPTANNDRPPPYGYDRSRREREQAEIKQEESQVSNKAQGESKNATEVELVEHDKYEVEITVEPVECEKPHSFNKEVISEFKEAEVEEEILVVVEEGHDDGTHGEDNTDEVMATPQVKVICESLRTRTHSKGGGMMRKWLSRPENAESQWSRQSEKAEKKAKTTHAWPKRRVRARMRRSRGRRRKPWTHAWPRAYRTGSRRAWPRPGNPAGRQRGLDDTRYETRAREGLRSLVRQGIARDQARGDVHGHAWAMGVRSARDDGRGAERTKGIRVPAGKGMVSAHGHEREIIGRVRDSARFLPVHRSISSFLVSFHPLFLFLYLFVSYYSFCVMVSKGKGKAVASSSSTESVPLDVYHDSQLVELAFEYHRWDPMLIGHLDIKPDDEDGDRIVEENAADIEVPHWRRPVRKWSDPAVDFEGEPSILTDADVVILREQVRIPPSVRVFAPYPGERITSPPPGCVGVFAESLRSGLRFPLPNLITEYLRSWGLPLCQITPNSWKKIIGLMVLLHEKGEGLPSYEEIRSIFAFKRSPKRHVAESSCCFFAGAKPQRGVKVGEIITDIPETLHGFQEEWLWIGGEWQSESFFHEPRIDGMTIPMFIHTGAIETSVISEEKKALEAEVADLKARLAVVEQHFKTSEVKLEETAKALSDEKAGHEATRKGYAEVRELVSQQREAHQADVLKLEREKSEYGEFMYENGFQAGKDSMAEVQTVQADDMVAEVEEEDGPDLELEMNTCLALWWVIERFDAGYYDIDDL